MKEQLISFETAKLAKEKGFPQNFSYAQFINMGKGEWKFYNKEDADNLDDSIGIGKNIRCSAPTQSLLQKWLRKVHGIDVLPYKVGDKYTTVYNGSENEGLKNTYEEALEKGLQEALKLIKV